MQLSKEHSFCAGVCTNNAIPEIMTTSRDQINTVKIHKGNALELHFSLKKGRAMDTDTLHIKNKQSGFTLIELFIAIMILAIGLSAAATMQAVALDSNSIANRISVSSSLAQQVAEEISSRSIADPLLNTNSAGTYQFDDWSTGAQQLVNSLSIAGAGTFTASYTIRANTFTGASFPGMTESQVTVNIVTYTTHKMVL